RSIIGGKHGDRDVRILYQVGDSEEDLPVCAPNAVCSKIDLYETPWIERQCRCPDGRTCPSSLGVEDGHTIADKTRHYKMCQPVHKLPVCKHFRDYTWTLTTAAELNVTEQIVHCRCPRNSVTYLTKREPIGNDSPGYRYLFACSPLTRLRCQRKQPCKLFTVRKRQEFLDEVNINSLCQCPKGHRCPSHHTQSGVIAGESFLEDNIQTYSGYCMANDHHHHHH
uniref:Protein giant-lens n=1 Tax=Drosophila melanogaster TaxID=7227 RepID=UPI00017546D4|nr:Chain A, Protein giant-lens [Drosophila melanogaster]3C9A_B Chain B, Protein giant-lens [Drosophila melanogaster]3CGU_A Chain A, Protein giant-lens [unidentified]3CGU_B Chain B, Protein giant-lens [unidentified]